MLYIVFLLITRKPTTPEEFNKHWEQKRISIVESLVGPLFPLH